MDKENPNLVKRVSSKETKPLNYEHRTRHYVEWPLGFASSTILKNSKYDSTMTHSKDKEAQSPDDSVNL